MIRTMQMRHLLVAGMAAALALSVGATAWADSQEGPLKIHAAPAEDFVDFTTANGTYQVAGVVGPGDVPGWQFGGIVRFVKDEATIKDWTYWYTEACYVISGTGSITASTIPFTSPQSYEVGPGDMFFIPDGTRVSFAASSDDPLVIFYAAPE